MTPSPSWLRFTPGVTSHFYHSFVNKLAVIVIFITQGSKQLLDARPVPSPSVLADRLRAGRVRALRLDRGAQR